MSKRTDLTKKIKKTKIQKIISAEIESWDIRSNVYADRADLRVLAEPPPVPGSCSRTHSCISLHILVATKMWRKGLLGRRSSELSVKWACGSSGYCIFALACRNIAMMLRRIPFG
ncbi:RRM domain-containing protein [Psidium guajava]|nr:RRM domain-containing protein [Psidium guajava]